MHDPAPQRRRRVVPRHPGDPVRHRLIHAAIAATLLCGLLYRLYRQPLERKERPIEPGSSEELELQLASADGRVDLAHRDAEDLGGALAAVRPPTASRDLVVIHAADHSTTMPVMTIRVGSLH